MGEEAPGGREGPGELGPQARARVPVELRQLQRRPPEGVAVWPEALPGGARGAGAGVGRAGGESLSRLCAVVDGPEGTPFAGGSFRLSVAVPFRYPFEPPKVRFITPVYHPNIDSEGRICLDTFNRAWKPSLSLSAVLLTVRLLLAEPNSDDGLMADIADEYRTDYPLFCSKARDLVRRYAMEHVQRGVGAGPARPEETTTASPGRAAACAEAKPAQGRPIPHGQGGGAGPLGAAAAVRGGAEAGRDGPSTAGALPACGDAQTGSGGGGERLQGSPAAKRSKVSPVRGDRAGGGGEPPVRGNLPCLSGGGGRSPSKDAPKRTSRLSLRRR